MRKPLKLVADGVDGSSSQRHYIRVLVLWYAPLVADYAEGGDAQTVEIDRAEQRGRRHSQSFTRRHVRVHAILRRLRTSHPHQSVLSRIQKETRQSGAALDGDDELWPKPTVLVFFIGGVTLSRDRLTATLIRDETLRMQFPRRRLEKSSAETLLDRVAAKTWSVSRRVVASSWSGNSDTIVTTSTRNHTFTSTTTYILSPKKSWSAPTSPRHANLVRRPRSSRVSATPGITPACPTASPQYRSVARRRSTSILCAQCSTRRVYVHPFARSGRSVRRFRCVSRPVARENRRRRCDSADGSSCRTSRGVSARAWRDRWGGHAAV